MEDLREFDEYGKPIYKRGLRQNADYHRNVIGQCVFWYKKDRIKNKKPITLSDKALANYFHEKLKEMVLMPIFGIESTTELTTENMPEYIAECFLYLSIQQIKENCEGVDIFEYGEL